MASAQSDVWTEDAGIFMLILILNSQNPMESVDLPTRTLQIPFVPTRNAMAQHADLVWSNAPTPENKQFENGPQEFVQR